MAAATTSLHWLWYTGSSQICVSLGPVTVTTPSAIDLSRIVAPRLFRPDGLLRPHVERAVEACGGQTANARGRRAVDEDGRGP